jgi:XTP/dITP diphosphohydrolase
MNRRFKAKLASRNEHKLRELARALPGWELELPAAEEFPPERGSTYYENARAKARFGRGLGDLDAWILGEDSGVEVVALNGGPGVHSARWAGEQDPVDRLLEELAAVLGDGRRARYVCELVGLSPQQEEFRGAGVLDGTIAPERRGAQGFGYDPIFVPEGEIQTVAELGNDWKSGNSHRARAARALLEAIGIAGVTPAPGPRPARVPGAGRSSATS